MGRASRKGQAAGPADGARAAAPRLSADSQLVGFGPDLAITPWRGDVSSDEVATTLIYFDPRSGHLVEEEVELSFEYSGDQSGYEDEIPQMRSELEAQLLQRAEAALAAGEDLDDISAEDQFEFTLSSGMSWDRSEPNYQSAEVEASASLFLGDGPARVIEDPLRALGDIGSSRSRELLQQMLLERDPSSLSPEWTEKVLEAQRDVVLASLQQSARDLFNAHFDDPRVNSVEADLFSLHKELREDWSTEQATERLESIADRLEWSTSVLRRALRKIDSEPAKDLQKAEESLQNMEETLALLRRVASELAPALQS